MKTRKLNLASIIMMMAALIFSACSESGINDPVDETPKFEYQIPVIDIQAATVNEASIDNEMTIVNSTVTKQTYNFTEIIEAMGLDDAQKELVRIYMNEHKEYLTEKFSDLVNEENARIMEANLTRQGILNELRNEIIDDETASVRISAINAEVRKMMEKDAIYAAFERDVFMSRHSFIAKVKEMLNDEQKQMWNRYTVRNNDIFLGPIN